MDNTSEPGARREPRGRKNTVIYLISHTPHLHSPGFSPSATMGKSQSKLSAEQLADLQKNTYCVSTSFSSYKSHTITVDKKELQQWSVYSADSHISTYSFSGTKDSARIVRLALWIGQSSRGYISNFFPLAIPQSLQIMCSTCLMKTRTGLSISRNSSLH